MERPSHMSFPQLCLPCRLPMLAAALSFQVLIVWLFLNGTGMRIVEVIRGPVEVTFKETQQPKKTPPTEPKLAKLPPIVAIMPQIPQTKGLGDETRITPVPGGGVSEPVPTPVVTRAPLRNAATNTTPPYPIIARRLGWEGTVTLRLSVTEGGRVARAEVVTSSGHDELDRAAQAWVVERWTYKPARRDGAPVPGQVTARVQFSLDGQ